MKLRALRLTWLSTRLPTEFRLGGVLDDADLIKTGWTNPASAKQLGPPWRPWRYPWLDGAGRPVEPDRAHWLAWCELAAFTGDVKPAFVNDLLTKAVPLLADTLLVTNEKTAPMKSGRVELFLHPWAVSCAVSATLQLPADTDVAGAAVAATAFGRSQSVAVGVEPANPTDPPSLAKRLAEHGVVALTGTEIDPTVPQLDPLVVATVIDGEPGSKSQTAPVSGNQLFCDALQALAGDSEKGSSVRWIKTIMTGDAECDPTRITNVRRSGVAQWFHDAIESSPSDIRYRTGTRHREAVLRLVVLRSAHALVERSVRSSDPGWMGSMAETVTQLLRRHYGLAGSDRNFLPQSYIDLHRLNASLRDPTSPEKAKCP